MEFEAYRVVERHSRVFKLTISDEDLTRAKLTLFDRALLGDENPTVTDQLLALVFLVRRIEQTST